MINIWGILVQKGSRLSIPPSTPLHIHTHSYVNGGWASMSWDGIHTWINIGPSKVHAPEEATNFKRRNLLKKYLRVQPVTDTTLDVCVCV